MALPGLGASGGLASLLPVAMLAVGLFTVLKKRRAGRAAPDLDDEAERKRGAAMEMERRMASYLAGLDTGDGYARPEAENGQENGR